MKHQNLLMLCCAVVLLLAHPALGSSPETAIPRCSFEQGAIIISDLAPGESAVVLGINLVRQNGVARTERVVATSIADAAGTARVTLTAPVNLFSRFAIVGLESGRHVVAAPPDSPLRRWSEVRERVRPGHASLADFLESSRATADLLVVSPRHGAWYGWSGDGYVNDADGAADGKTTFSIDQLTPVDPSYQPIRTLRPGDVLLVIDRYSFDYSAQVVNQ